MTAIYLDHQATTPLDLRVLEAMMPWLSRPSNPHATHAIGRAAAEAVETARGQVAALVGAQAHELFFTAGATEAANIAIRALPSGSRVLVSPIEHACVVETLVARATELDVTTARIGPDGVLDVDDFAEDLEGRDVAIVMAVNNEIGTVQPLPEIAAACRLADVALFTDVSQAAGRVRVDLEAWDARAAWLSSHKVYGPQGMGALIWRGLLQPRPVVTGGGQERGVRAGTVATALAVGFGAACHIAMQEMERDAHHAAALSAQFLSALRQVHPWLVVNGSTDRRVPHNLSVAFPGLDADVLVASVPQLAISTGSACSAGAIGVSHVLSAIADPEIAEGTIRVGFGRHTTPEEVATAASVVCQAVTTLRSVSSRKVG
ncbi:cysteine desulfurase family protein [Glacieibacterium frigidum]|uniref:Cysteine desulfurase n=1 Tax=Glacieibacterium frigidum TaxID=2593303 RepID=A0A552U8F8_9SPHN|nr:cysteine desulfurase family protein [Glacieibacterium frigidum]TRW14500.1 cysteine desulfurase [Glacieibacterium frigidum]